MAVKLAAVTKEAQLSSASHEARNAAQAYKQGTVLYDRPRDVVGALARMRTGSETQRRYPAFQIRMAENP